MDINRQWDLRKESALWLVDNFPSLKCNNHKEGEGLFSFFECLYISCWKAKAREQTGKAGPRVAVRTTRRADAPEGGVRRDEGLTGRRGWEQSPGVSSRVVGPLGCPSTQPALWQRAECGQAQGWERGPLERRWGLPDPRGQRFPQRRRTPSVLSEKPSAFLHAVLCRVPCVCVWRLVRRVPWAAHGSPWAWLWAGAYPRPRNKFKVSVETGGSGVHRTGPGGACSVHTPLLTARHWLSRDRCRGLFLGFIDSSAQLPETLREQHGLCSLSQHCALLRWGKHGCRNARLTGTAGRGHPAGGLCVHAPSKAQLQGGTCRPGRLRSEHLFPVDKDSGTEALGKVLAFFLIALYVPSDSRPPCACPRGW